MPAFKLDNLSGQPIQSTQELADLFRSAENGVMYVNEDFRVFLARLYRAMISQGLVSKSSRACAAVLPISPQERDSMEDLLNQWFGGDEAKRAFVFAEMIRGIKEKLAKNNREAIAENLANVNADRIAEVGQTTIPQNSGDLMTLMNDCIVVWDQIEDVADRGKRLLNREYRGLFKDENGRVGRVFSALKKELESEGLITNGKWLKSFNLSEDDQEELEFNLNLAKISDVMDIYLNRMVAILKEYCQPPLIH